MNKASGGDGIPADLFQILKDDAVKALHSICQQIWKTQQWLQDWKRTVFIPIPKKALAPQLEKTHKTPPSSRDEGHLFLHGLESNPGSSLQTEVEAGLP